MKMTTLKITKNHEEKIRSSSKKLEVFIIFLINVRNYINNYFSLFGTLKYIFNILIFPHRFSSKFRSVNDNDSIKTIEVKLHSGICRSAVA